MMVCVQALLSASVFTDSALRRQPGAAHAQLHPGTAAGQKSQYGGGKKGNSQ